MRRCQRTQAIERVQDGRVDHDRRRELQSAMHDAMTRRPDDEGCEAAGLEKPGYRLRVIAPLRRRARNRESRGLRPCDVEARRGVKGGDAAPRQNCERLGLEEPELEAGRPGVEDEESLAHGRLSARCTQR